MSARIWVAAVVAIAGVISWTDTNVEVAAQSCNTSPNRPATTNAARASDGNVLITWTVSGGCEATRFYLEASRGTSEVIEQTVDDGDDRSVTMTLAPATGTPWRISVRGFNQFGLSPGRSAILNEGPVVLPPNPCPSGELPAPVLTGAQVFNRTLIVQWQPDDRCTAAITNFVIVGSLAPGGPILGSVTVPYPNVRSWSGEVPSGSYYVSVVTQYYTKSSAPSAAMLINVP